MPTQILRTDLMKLHMVNEVVKLLDDYPSTDTFHIWPEDLYTKMEQDNEILQYELDEASSKTIDSSEIEVLHEHLTEVENEISIAQTNAKTALSDLSDYLNELEHALDGSDAYQKVKNTLADLESR